MLIEFSVANYRSFRDPVTFSMVAAPLKSKYPELDQNNVFAVTSNLKLLASSAVYGANASGKSNLIAALAFMRQFVLGSQRGTSRTGGINVSSFLLDVSMEEKPSFFEVIFIHEGLRYRYGFEVTTQKVESEWLYVIPQSREAKLFVRTGENITLGSRFRSEGKNLLSQTRPNALYLSVVAQFDGEIAQKIVDWFRSCTITSGLTDIVMRTHTEQMLIDDENSAPEIIRMIQQLDLGIEGLQAEKTPLPISSLEDTAEELRMAIVSIWDFIKKETGREVESVTIKTHHRRFSQSTVPQENAIFDLDEHESEGTKKLVAISGPIVDALRHGRVLVIDELDARLHPLLTRAIVRYFNDPQTNTGKGQLIFATHDTNLLDNRLLRRDQIWFVEKNRQGVSHLYSLAEFKVRNDASFEKDYIQGRYGAIPFLGGLHSVME